VSTVTFIAFNVPVGGSYGSRYFSLTRQAKRSPPGRSTFPRQQLIKREQQWPARNLVEVAEANRRHVLGS
jgi:hypothetical protein